MSEKKQEKWMTVEIGGYPKRCTESELPKVLEAIEKIKQDYLKQGKVPKEDIEEIYSVKIVRDED